MPGDPGNCKLRRLFVPRPWHPRCYFCPRSCHSYTQIMHATLTRPSHNQSILVVGPSDGRIKRGNSSGEVLVLLDSRVRCLNFRAQDKVGGEHWLMEMTSRGERVRGPGSETGPILRVLSAVSRRVCIRVSCTHCGLVACLRRRFCPRLLLSTYLVWCHEYCLCRFRLCTPTVLLTLTRARAFTCLPPLVPRTSASSRTS